MSETSRQRRIAEREEEVGRELKVESGDLDVEPVNRYVFSGCSNVPAREYTLFARNTDIRALVAYVLSRYLVARTKALAGSSNILLLI